jgi:hypothetical protein
MRLASFSVSLLTKTMVGSPRICTADTDTCHYLQLCCTVVTQHTSYNLVTEKYRQGVQELREQKQTCIWVASSCSSSVSIFKNRTLSPYSTASCKNPQGPTVHELMT